MLLPSFTILLATLTATFPLPVGAENVGIRVVDPRMSRLELVGKASLLLTLLGGSALILGLAFLRLSQN